MSPNIAKCLLEKKLPLVESRWPSANLSLLCHHVERKCLRIKSIKRAKPRDNKAVKERPMHTMAYFKTLDRSRDTCWLLELIVRGLWSGRSRAESGQPVGCAGAGWKSWDAVIRGGLSSGLARGSRTQDPRLNSGFAPYQPYDLGQNELVLNAPLRSWIICNNTNLKGLLRYLNEIMWART